jgi:hypothetical protein
VEVITDVLEAHLALEKDRWTRARADADALLIRNEYRRRQDAGEARPQDDMAVELGTLQPGISRSVKRGDEVANDPVRLADARAQAAAAGIDLELLG